MIAKIFIITVFVAYSQAGVFELAHTAPAATSYSSISKHVAAPAVIKTGVPVAHFAHVAPIAHVAPVVHVAHVAPVAHVAHVVPVTHVAHVSQVVKAIHKEVHAHSHPHYSFEYGVKDTHTRDIKNQHEERDGDVVKGEYSLVQPDGTTRIVHYSADDHNGFNAQVEVTGHGSHPQLVAKAIVPAKTIGAAPIYHAYH